MQVHNILANNPHVGFGSQRERDAAAAFTNLNDYDVQQLAYLKTQEACPENKFKRKMNALWYSVPVVAGLRTGALVQGSLAKKSVAGIRNGAGWLVAFAAIGVYNKIANAIYSHSPKLQRARENNPFLTTFADLSLAYGSMILAGKGLEKGAQIAKIKLPNITASLKKGIVNIYKKVYNSKANTELMPKIAQFAGKINKKAPWAMSAGKSVAYAAPMIMLVAGLVKSFKHVRNKQTTFQENFNNIKEEQLIIARNLAGVYAKENTALKTQICR